MYDDKRYSTLEMAYSFCTITHS